MAIAMVATTLERESQIGDVDLCRSFDSICNGGESTTTTTTSVPHPLPSRVFGILRERMREERLVSHLDLSARLSSSLFSNLGGPTPLQSNLHESTSHSPNPGVRIVKDVFFTILTHRKEVPGESCKLN
ncbi:hypothetical protein ACSBR1_024978 [Camellia fascicularis]